MSRIRHDLAAYPARGYGLDTGHAGFRAAARAWTLSVVAPLADRADAGVFPSEAIAAAATEGYMGILAPRRFGGMERSHLSFALFIEEVAAACASTAIAIDVHASVGTEPLLLKGSDRQKTQFLPGLARGMLLGAFALTEPEAGSDAAALRSSARREGGHYVLEGSKIFITNGGFAHIYTILASTDRQAGARGISAFLVPADTNGLNAGPRQHKLGLRGSATTELVMTGCRVPVEQRLGDEGEGFRIAMLALDRGRIGISAQAIGIARAALQCVLDHHAHSGALYCDLECATCCELAGMATRIDAARLLTWEAARQCDSGLNFTTTAAMAKLLSTDTAMAVTTRAIDLVAGDAPIETTCVLERYFRDAKATQLYEGTNQIQRLVIARRVLGM